MAHTLAADKNSSTRESEDVDIIIIDPDQEQHMAQVREALIQSRMKTDRTYLSPLVTVRKRYRASSSCEEEPANRRRRAGLLTREDVRNKANRSSPDILTDDLLIEVFKHLPPLPSLLSVRQVCKRWYAVSCNPRLWRTLSFEGQEHVTTNNLTALCRTTRCLQRLQKLSLAKIHGVTDSSVRFIPRTECAATLESVDLSWCSGASDKSVVEFSRCPGLRELRLSHCKMVTRRSVRILAVRCPRLEVLDMNCISGVRDSLLEVIGQNCPYLRILNIANARNVTDEGIAHIAKGCPRLEGLDLSWCGKVTDWSISKIAFSMKDLVDVGLSETRVTDVGISDLTKGCSKLEALHLARCIYITNRGVDSIITQCSERLTSLNLASCQHVSDDYVEKLIQVCPKLKCLDVSKLPCRVISEMLERETASRDIEVYF
eukprot:GFKZ01000379.1.p1 GENE.GFKZ01000379.1~~GFKZ01000379.1.p1  ORF type:complete len:431 (-),score=22.78 GFKZ01000379.1:1118-2410(-)